MTDHGTHLDQMRAQAPLVHNITNYVAMNIMANVLLAVGASPAMVHARQEVAEFAGLAQALTVNIGTADPDWVEAMALAAQVMTQAGRPWVLDPVGVGATRFRQDACARLVDLGPSIIRGNASEILALAGTAAAGRGADAADSVAAAQEAALALARRSGAVVAVSGPEDFVTDGQQSFHVANGHPMMPRITALGCSLNGVIAAFRGSSPSAARNCFGAGLLRAGGRAGRRAQRGAGWVSTRVSGCALRHDSQRA